MLDAAFGREALGASLSALILGGYQLWMRAKTRRDPDRSQHALNRLTRGAWVEAVMADTSSGILAVQTLRNSVMASSLMASTAVLLIIGALSAAADPARFLAWHALSPGADAWPAGTLLKLIALLGALFLSFFFFAMAVRSFNHVGYMVTLAREHRPPELTPALAAAHLDRAGFYHFLGLRSFLFCVPLVFWLFGPHFMVGAAAGLVLALYRLDRAPPPMPGDAPS